MDFVIKMYGYGLFVYNWEGVDGGMSIVNSGILYFFIYLIL